MVVPGKKVMLEKISGEHFLAAQAHGEIEGLSQPLWEVSTIQKLLSAGHKELVCLYHMGCIMTSKVPKWKAVRGIKLDTLLPGTEVDIEEVVAAKVHPPQGVIGRADSTNAPYAEGQMVVRSITTSTGLGEHR